jgi:6-pyruvoyltetrahydropterin/6-carboxytetrahydropterin synthase
MTLKRLYTEGIPMKMRLSKTFTFDAAHQLRDYHGVCARVHGHTYTLVVTVEGEPDDTGMIIDFVAMKKIVTDTIITKIDHTYLNDFYDQPTVENVATDIFETLDTAFKKKNVQLYAVKLYEGEKSCVEVFS